MDNSRLMYHSRTLLQCNATALLQVAADALHWKGFLQSTLQTSETSKQAHIRLTSAAQLSSADASADAAFPWSSLSLSSSPRIFKLLRELNNLSIPPSTQLPRSRHNGPKPIQNTIRNDQEEARESTRWPDRRRSSSRRQAWS